VAALAAERPSADETELAWQIVDEMSVRAAPLLLPAFEATGGRQGRLSTQTDPTFHRSAPRMLAQSLHFRDLAPNIIVKFPATSAGLDAMEEASARGVSVNTTVCFSVAQAVAAAEAIERGIRRREAAGEPAASMGPVVTIMMGRIEDWLRVQTERDGIVADPAVLPWSGVAVFKRAYGLFRERGYRARLLGAAIRHQYHWSELIGGDVVITMPASWQRRFNASSVEVQPRMDDPVDPAIVAELAGHYPDFVRAYEPDGLGRDEFDGFPPTARTLRAFIASYHELLHQVTDAMIPNPDLRPAS
jgi:transaldolase